MDNQGTNQFLQPKNSPIALSQGAVSAYDFSAGNDRNSINLTKIRNFRFDQAVGGTLTLGGTANGDGVMVVKDSSGSTIVTVDNAGILIDGGNILIKNSSGNTILDTTGIVSTANFQTDSAFNGAAGISTTSTSYVDVTGSSLDTLVLTRSTRVLLFIMGYGLNNNAIGSNGNDGIDLGIYDSYLGDTASNTLFYGFTCTNVVAGTAGTDFYLNISDEMSTRTTVLNAAAGTHNYSLKYKATNGGTAYIDAWDVGYMVLGS